MGERIAIQSILNATSPPSDFSSPASDVPDAFPLFGDSAPAPSKAKKTRDSSDLSYSRATGYYKFAPFEDLDEKAMGMIRPYKIYPFGEIGAYTAHIPYSSDKKDVMAKTGREKFEIFVYKFTDPADDKPYEIMWDVKGPGYVRISPFFKCLKHKKTGPAKMHEANEGLREVSFHMTGGNRIAQGYWLPYRCARAVCVKFCYPIAGALIPIFGPTFPDDCVKPDSPHFGRMDIDPQEIADARSEALAYRLSARAMPVTSHPRDEENRYSRFGAMMNQGLQYAPVNTSWEEMYSRHPRSDPFFNRSAPSTPPQSSTTMQHEEPRDAQARDVPPPGSERSAWRAINYHPPPPPPYHPSPAGQRLPPIRTHNHRPSPLPQLSSSATDILDPRLQLPAAAGDPFEKTRKRHQTDDGEYLRKRRRIEPSRHSNDLTTTTRRVGLDRPLECRRSRSYERQISTTGGGCTGKEYEAASILEALHKTGQASPTLKPRSRTP